MHISPYFAILAPDQLIQQLFYCTGINEKKTVIQKIRFAAPMRMRNCWFIFIIPILLSCGLKQPIEHNAQQAVGSVFVSSAPQGADILLDREATAKVTPDTLFDIPVGLHSIRLVMPEFTATPDSQLVQVVENQV